jgi:hypothetical protein
MEGEKQIMKHECPKGKSDLVKCAAPAWDSNEGLQIVLEPSKFLHNKSSFAAPFARTNCGFIEWYVENPEMLR